MEATQVKEPVGEQALPSPKKPVFQIPKKRKKWIKWLIAAAVVGAGYWFVLRPMMAGGAPVAAASYITQAAQRRDLSVSVSGTGTLTPIESYNVTALVSGEVLSSPFEIGDQVEKDALLYQIDADDAQTSIQQAQLSVRQAQLSYDSAVESLNPSAGGSGVVQQLYVKKGDMISAGSPIADISDTSTMTLTASFHSMDAAQLYVGQQATVTVDGTLETLTGTIDSISAADQVGSGGTLLRQVKLRVQNPGALTSSTSGTVTVGGIDCASGGTFQANLQQTIVAQTSGEVTQVHVSVGSAVTSGTTLVTLGGTAANSTLENAAIALENAQLSLQRSQDALDSYTITAPISGTVIEKNFKAGDKVNSMDSGTLAVLYDLTALKLKMDVNELDIGQVKESQEVEITAAALPGQVFHGVVERVSINGSTTQGFTTYPVTIRLDEYGSLTPGMNVSATILCDAAKDVLTVPVAAVSRGNTVLVAGEGALNEDGTVADPAKLEERAVTLGSSDEEYIEITDGLKDGESVAYQDPAIADAMGVSSGG